MPYDSISQLPDAVRRHLPEPAQQIDRKVFNNAWEEYAGREDRESIAHEVAWAAVGKRYRKQGDRWVRRHD